MTKKKKKKTLSLVKESHKESYNQAMLPQAMNKMFFFSNLRDKVSDVKSL